MPRTGRFFPNKRLPARLPLGHKNGTRRLESANGQGHGMSETTRRSFLLGGACIAGTVILSPSRAAAAVPLGIQPGVQLWTVKDELASDFEGTLRALRRIGYRKIEAAGWQNRTPAAFRRAVVQAGLDPVSCHFSMGDLIADPETRLAEARDVGATWVVGSSPKPGRPMAEGLDWNRAVSQAMTLDAWHSNAEAMNRIGRRARDLGLRFAYHNHSAEFLAYQRKLGMDEIVRLTDPGLVSLELDIGWAAAAGYDPVEAVTRYCDRIRLLHVKDIATDERTPGRIAANLTTVPVGRGTINWPAVFAAARRARIHSYFVEQEPPFAQPPLEALAQSYAYLKGLR